MVSLSWTEYKGTLGGDGECNSRLIRAVWFLTCATRIFILEGIFTVVIAALSKFVIVDWPEHAKFLTEEERELLIARLAADVAVLPVADDRAAEEIIGYDDNGLPR